ncbi:MAG: beta-CASP ribonuclease aCPSF1 [Candidatus Nanoarchaeia archaeon]|nr:beta-CASP ribonuclease aCPSF1 [Candidatus Nanoarchaeia archaeon]MDD5587479.1 beta-CASP ribonuclease aCPSF1 [Candidatus Nanoarchaeia archaeon]
MVNILDEIMKQLPSKANISGSFFEGANIVLYTKNKEFFLEPNGLIREIVDKIKKRIELRCDPSLVLGLEDAEKIIKELLPKDCGLAQVIFDVQRSVVTIEVEKPGVAIGKGGELLREIRKQTLWVPLIKRTPAIRSIIIENIRKVLYENNDYRKKFLNKVGKRVYEGYTKERKHEWVRVSFLGAAREVGRSCLLLQTQESRILMDCGINVANENDQFPLIEAPEFSISDLDAVIATHAHVDHMAMIPLLYKYGFTGPTYCTEPTRDIMALLCLDVIAIAQKEGKKPMYSSSDIKEMVKHTICLDFEEVTDITPDVRLTLYNSGHALGSAMAHLHIGEGLHNLLYTSDMNYETSNLLNPASTKFPRLETCIIESTYGGKDDKQISRQESEDQLIKVIQETVARHGKIIMPILGVGRSQEVMLIIERIIREGKLEKIPIYIQGMCWDITAIHTAYPDFFNTKIKKQIFHENKNPFLSDVFKMVGSQKEMEQVVNEEGPCVIMATSGMMQGGPIVDYFKKLADNKNNSIIFTCYQGEGSLGRRIEHGEKEINLGNNEKPEVISVKMEVHSIKGFSGHSSRDQLMNFVHRLEPRPKKIIVQHGENSKCLDLASSLHKTYNLETNAPKNLEVIRLR